LCWSSGYTFSHDSAFAAANQLYEEQEYISARESYLELVERNYESAALYFNIGNCYFKERKFGYAILYYLKAQRLSPGDDEIETNLKFARQFMPTRLEGVKINPATTFFEMLTGPFTLETLAWISSALFIVLFLFLCLVVARRLGGPLVKIIIYCLIITLLFSSTLTTYKYRANIATKSGVIVADRADILNSPSDNGELLFVSSFGLQVEIERATDRFYRVIFENQTRGWIKKDDIGII
jgi:tetratricopeptide (TPR) repeat protein